MQGEPGGRQRQQAAALKPAMPGPWGVPEPAMTFLSNAVAVPSLVLGTLLEAGELPDLGALPLAPAPSLASSAALARSGAALCIALPLVTHETADEGECSCADEPTSLHCPVPSPEPLLWGAKTHCWAAQRLWGMVPTKQAAACHAAAS